MCKWQLYITANNGDDVPQRLMVWDDGEEFLELRLAAFSKDAVISIEPYINANNEEVL